MNSGDMSDDTRLVMSASYSWMVVCISVDSSMSDVRVLVGGWVDVCVWLGRRCEVVYRQACREERGNGRKFGVEACSRSALHTWKRPELFLRYLTYFTEFFPPHPVMAASHRRGERTM